MKMTKSVEHKVSFPSYNLSVCSADSSPSREPLAKRRGFTKCQSLPSVGQRRRPPPVAETGRSCWGRGRANTQAKRSGCWVPQPDNGSASALTERSPLAASYILCIACASSACVPALSQMMTGSRRRSASSSIRGCGSGPNWVSAKVQWRFSPPAEYSMREKWTVEPPGALVAQHLIHPVKDGGVVGPGLDAAQGPGVQVAEVDAGRDALVHPAEANTSSSVPSWPILPMVSGQRVISP